MSRRRIYQESDSRSGVGGKRWVDTYKVPEEFDG